jgi:hypothetical protein
MVDVEMVLERRVTVRMMVEVADVDEGMCEDLTPGEIATAQRLADAQPDGHEDWRVAAVHEVKP